MSFALAFDLRWMFYGANHHPRHEQQANHTDRNQYAPFEKDRGPGPAEVSTAIRLCGGLAPGRSEPPQPEMRQNGMSSSSLRWPSGLPLGSLPGGRAWVAGRLLPSSSWKLKI